jgi:hypothetical protein
VNRITGTPQAYIQKKIYFFCPPAKLDEVSLEEGKIVLKRLNQSLRLWLP